MTTQPDYKTAANGAIDYAHYMKRAHDIRSRDAWNAINALGSVLKRLTGLFGNKKAGTVEQISNSPTRAPMRSPDPRRVTQKPLSAKNSGATNTVG